MSETAASTVMPAQDQLLLGAITGTPGQAQRRAIAKAITLLESTRTDHRARADDLLNALLPQTGHSFRLGISGVPGVGKSTFIEVLGLHLIAQGHRVAVLTVDPSSKVSGGSILGDKTRMERLSVNERAYIRPSPTSGTLGGVAEKTREAMLVCEAAGHDIVIVETVGVGQSETAVSGMTDMLALLQLPNAGDDLQAIKKGVMEIADLVVVNKADIDEASAMRAQAHITSALRLFGLHGRAQRPPGRPKGAGAPPGGGEQGEPGGPSDTAHHDESLWHPQVLRMSALREVGVADFWTAVERFRDVQTTNGQLQRRRLEQDQSWMWERIESGLRERFKSHAAVRSALPAQSEDVRAGRVAPSVAARRLLDLFNPQ